MADQTHAGGAAPTARGASASAPAAPHATPSSAPTQRTGPARFWAPARARVVAAVCVALSVGVHYAVLPWSLLPTHEFELRDTAGTLAIPVDLLQGDPAPEPPPPPPPPPPEAPPAPGPGDAIDASVAHAGRDAAHPKDARDADDDAGPRRHDAAADAAAEDASREDAPKPDALPGAALDAAIAQAGQDPGPVRDAVGMIGAAGNAQAGPQLVVVTINMAVIRTHPVGSRIGPLFSALPQWDDFLVGTGIDPLRDTDWVSINGPSLIHSESDVILVHYSASDATVDRALDFLSRKSAKGKKFDAGVPRVKAVMGHADRADRVFMRPQPHVVAVVPPFYAPTAAKLLVHATVPTSLKRTDEALRLKLFHPHGPMPAIPESVTELRLWIVPRDQDGSADVYGEGDTASPLECEEAVDVLRRVVREQNSIALQLFTHGLLDGVEIKPDGATVRLHAPASRDQLEVILAFVAGRLGVDIPPPDAGAPSPATPPSAPARGAASR